MGAITTHCEDENQSISFLIFFKSTIKTTLTQHARMGATPRASGGMTSSRRTKTRNISRRNNRLCRLLLCVSFFVVFVREFLLETTTNNNNNYENGLSAMRLLGSFAMPFATFFSSSSSTTNEYGKDTSALDREADVDSTAAGISSSSSASSSDEEEEEGGGEGEEEATTAGVVGTARKGRRRSRSRSSPKSGGVSSGASSSGSSFSGGDEEGDDTGGGEDESAGGNTFLPTADHRAGAAAKEAMDMKKLRESFDIVLPQLWIPKTPEWKKANVKRILVTKAQNSNKYHPSGKNNPEVLPADDLHEKQFKTCAVVGNGGSNLNANYGEAIDAHDAVFRFNDGPTVGFENKVGSKTTFRVINNAWTRTWLRRKPRGASEDALLLFGAGAAKSMDALYKKWGSEEKVYFMAPEFAGAARGQYKKAYLAFADLKAVSVKGRNSPPTGVEGLYFAMLTCESVDLYGFGIDPDPSTPYHYHDKVKGVEAAHSFGFQAVFLRMLEHGGHMSVCLGKKTSDPPSCSSIER